MPGAWREKRWRFHGQQQWYGGSDGRDRSRSVHSQYRRYSGQRQPVIDERRVALFGDHRVGRYAFPNGGVERCEPLLHKRPGRRPMVVRWFRPKGSAPAFFTGERSEAWRALARSFLGMNDFPVLPDYAVISVSAMALTNKPAYCGEPVTLRSDAGEAADRVTSGVDCFLDVAQMCVLGVCPLVLSVVPDLNALPETLAASRRLSASLWKIARQKDALFIDVEEVVRRYMAAQEGIARGLTSGQQGDAAARTSPAPCGDKAATETVAEQEEAASKPGEGDKAATEPVAEQEEAASKPGEGDKAATEPVAEQEEAASKPGEGDKAATEPVTEQEEAASKPGEAGDGLHAAVDAELREPGAKMQQELRQKLREELRQELMKELRQPPVGDVPWQSGWAPGQPPPVCLSAPPLPAHVYQLGSSSCLSSVAYKAIRLEILRIASS